MKYFLVLILAVGAFAAPRQIPYRFHNRGQIVGGQAATPGQFPYQLSFEDTTFGYFHFCGASIYSTNYAICAGHCVYGENYDDPKNLVVVAGDQTLYVDEGNEQTITVARIILHESYDPATFENDISLLYIATAFVFNSYVAPVALPSAGDDFNGENCIVSGWGTTSSGGSSSDTLLYVSVPIVTDAVCRVDYGVSSIYDSMICAGEEGKDSCQGDSGGPLTCRSTPLLSGIVSWGYGCAVAGYPGVYTEVSYFIDWIATNAV